MEVLFKFRELSWFATTLVIRVGMPVSGRRFIIIIFTGRCPVLSYIWLSANRYCRWYCFRTGENIWLGLLSVSFAPCLPVSALLCASLRHQRNVSEKHRVEQRPTEKISIFPFTLCLKHPYSSGLHFSNILTKHLDFISNFLFDKELH